MLGENAVGLPGAGSVLLRLRPVAILTAILIAGVLLRYAVFLQVGGAPGFGNYLDSVCVWDCHWYDSIITGGYDPVPGLHGRPSDANWAFFPLYPTLVWALKTLTGLPVLVIGFVFSNALVLAAALASRPLFAQAQGAWWLFATTLLAGPFSFLFSTLYSESLFILLTILGLVALQRSSYLAAAAACALLSATRPTGVLFVFAIFAQMLVDHLRVGGSWRSFPARVLGDVKLVLPLFLAPLGLFVYMAFLYVQTGDALAFAHVQRSWGRGLANPFSTLAEVFGSALTIDYFALILHSWAWAAIIGLALSGALFLRGKPAAGLFCLLCIMVSLSTGVGSMVRFVVGLVPLGMVAAELLSPARLLVIPLALLIGPVLYVGWMNKSFFMM